jgi:hypothetical protein
MILVFGSRSRYMSGLEHRPIAPARRHAVLSIRRAARHPGGGSSYSATAFDDTRQSRHLEAALAHHHQARCRGRRRAETRRVK